MAVLEDLGSHVPETMLQTFMNFLAPPRPDYDINATMDILKSMPGGILSACGRWKALVEEPNDQSSSGHAV
jgi:hypothetical protein